MPQTAAHALVGLGVAKVMAPRVPDKAKVGVAVAAIAGAVFPDLDMYPAAVAFVTGHKELVHVLHRTATHSVWLVLLLAIAGMLLHRSSQTSAWVCWSAAAGMATHVFLDIFFFYWPVDLFWPLSHLPHEAPLLPVVNLWPAGTPEVPVLGNEDFLANLIEGAELAFVALYLLAVRRMAGCGEAPTVNTSRVLLWERVAWALFAVSVLTGVGLSESWQMTWVHGTLYLWFWPYSAVQTWRARQALVSAMQPAAAG